MSEGPYPARGVVGRCRECGCLPSTHHGKGGRCVLCLGACPTGWAPPTPGAPVRVWISTGRYDATLRKNYDTHIDAYLDEGGEHPPVITWKGRQYRLADDQFAFGARHYVPDVEAMLW